jgi:hypothetical protein
MLRGNSSLAKFEIGQGRKSDDIYVSVENLRPFEKIKELVNLQSGLGAILKNDY